MTRADNDIRPAQTIDLAAGTLLGGRYRLLGQVAPGFATSLWRGIDEVLARPVAIRVLAPVATDDQRARFRRAAGEAGRICHPRVAAVYDAGQQGGADYLVTEWVDARPLATVVREGALAPAAATAVAYQVAEALAAAHGIGVAHGRLLPGSVLLGGGQRVKVTDFGIAAAVAGPVPGLGGESAAADVRALGAVCYAALTGCFPAGAGFGLPAAPVRDAMVCTPRQVRAGIPKDLDSLVMRLLDPRRSPGRPALTTANEALAALLPQLAQTRTGASPAPRRRRPRRRWRRVVLPLALIAVMATGGWFAGYQVGQLPGVSAHGPGRARPANQAPAAPPALSVAGISDFDPPPGDGREQSTFVSAVTDGDRSTAWETDRYWGDARFGGLKPGVGLLVDLGHATTVGRVDLVLTAPGAAIELRAAAPGQLGAPTALAELPVVEKFAGLGTERSLTVRSAAPARYWLVWITSLPSDPGGGFREGIAELTLRPPG